MENKNSIEVLLHHDEWKCMRILHERPEGVGATVDFLAERTGWKPRHIADVLLKNLVKQGFLKARSFEFTPAGEAVYASHREWWMAILWKMRDWDLDPEILKDQADRMLDDVTPEFILSCMEKMEFDRIKEGAEAIGEELLETDFQGVLKTGSYRVEFTLLEPSGGISEWNDSFEGTGNLVIEPLKSHLELIWKNEKYKLLGLSCQMAEEPHMEAAVNGRVSVYLTAMRFERVPVYRLLDGETELTLYLSERGNADATAHRIPLRLELPLLYV